MRKKKGTTKERVRIERINAPAEPNGPEETSGLELLVGPASVPINDGRWLAFQIAVRDTKQEAEDAVTSSRHRLEPAYDFYAEMSAAELVRRQGVKPVLKLGQIRSFSNPNPAEAESFARQVRSWRRVRQASGV
jgi:hypothetical protein